MRIIKITDAINYFEEIMGVSLLKENLKLIKGGCGGGVSFGRSIENSLLEVPIVSHFWYKAREELAMNELTGEDKHGIYTLLTAVWGDELNSLRGTEILANLVANLTNKNNSLNAVGQLSIVSGYIRAGYSAAAYGNLLTINSGLKELFCIVQNVDQSLNEEQWCDQPVNSVLYLFPDHLRPKRRSHTDNKFLKGFNTDQNLNLPVIICDTFIEEEKNQPVLYSIGRLVNRNSINDSDIVFYIPNEKILFV